MTQRIILFLLIILLLGTLALPSRAQIFSDPATASLPSGSLQFGENNKQLKEVLDLQYQIQLLKRLLDHETSVNKMISAAIDIGIFEPTIPSPDLAICSALPANIPCAQSYSNLYENYSVEPVVADYSLPSSATMPGASTMMASGDIPGMSAHEGKKMPKLVPLAKVFWTDITCLGLKCSAVISPDPKDPGARYRIVQGEALPNGAVVQKISAAGVALEYDKKIIQLEPAPRV